jgi:phosphate transport system permease protein
MELKTRRILDRSFTGMGYASIVFLALALLVLLLPIFIRGIGAFVFRGTVEFRRLNYEQFARGDKATLEADLAEATLARKPVYDFLQAFSDQLYDEAIPDSYRYEKPFRDLRRSIEALLGPKPGQDRPVMMRDQYGKTRWDQVEKQLNWILFEETWDHSKEGAMGARVLTSRVEFYKGTALEGLFPYFEHNIKKMMRPELTFYWQFLFDKSFDAHFFGGIWPELLGTFYLVLGTMILAIPCGVIAAIYLTEFSRPGKMVSLLRTFISTLAGVPSIVFGLFGLAFFINTLRVSQSKSVLAGSFTLALLVLPTIIRASEEAIMAVPSTYKEAALSLGASRMRMVLTVILPAALPGILTGIVISMGRAAGETAPIIFTAAVSVGQPLKLLETFSQPTPALPWNIYNLVTEHEAVEQIRHVQFGMVFTLVLLVLLLNLSAILLRARISKRLRG